jgi:hypothetical protein
MPSFDPQQPDRAGYESDWNVFQNQIRELKTRIAALEKVRPTLEQVRPIGRTVPAVAPSPSVPDASATARGIVRLSTAPAGEPVAVADTDPRNADPRAPAGAAGGDLAGTYPNPSVATGAITSAKMAVTLTSGTVHLAKLTGGGANGSITLVNGVVTAFVDPT